MNLIQSSNEPDYDSCFTSYSSLETFVLESNNNNDDDDNMLICVIISNAITPLMFVPLRPLIDGYFVNRCFGVVV